MLYSTVLVAASALVSVAYAQDSNNTVANLPIPCCSVPANTIDEDDRSKWCLANRNTCNELCGGIGKVASNGNTCDRTTLEFECKCSNGTDLQSSLTDYEQSVPGQMCRAWFEACKNAAPDDADGQFACEQAEEQNCGKLTIQDATDAGNGGSSSSASGSATSSSPSATGSDSPSGTETSEASATSESAEGAAANLMTYGTPALVGGLFAIFGFAL